MLISVKHNIEVAHRLFETPGKCENVHGHSMWITLNLSAHWLSRKTGMAVGPLDAPLEFGDIKKRFRGFLDDEYDHRLLLNRHDPFSGPVYYIDETGNVDGKQHYIPGLQTTEGDPTTENIAKWVYEWASIKEGLPAQTVEVWETSVNRVIYP